MGNFLEFGAAMAAFLATHSVPAIPPIRERLIAAAGRRQYLIGYSAVSVLILAWLIAAVLRLPHIQLWHPQPWAIWFPTVTMPIACIFLTMGLAAPNPLSISFRPLRGERRASGIVAITRHPVLWGFVLWAGSHIPPNGDVARVVLFGLLLVFALVGMPLADKRARQRLGESAWRRLSKGTSAVPFAALIGRRSRFQLGRADYAWAAVGIVLWLVLLALHQPVIGVSPFPY